MESAVPELEIREIETVDIEPPPPPPPMEEPPPDAPPPPPALTQVSTLPDPSRVPIPQAQVPMDITAPVENFFTDLAPAPLPVAPEPVRTRPAPRPSTPSPKPAPARRPTPPPVAKSHYSASELDGSPRLLRHGSASFPSALARRGVNRGTVTFEVELLHLRFRQHPACRILYPPGACLRRTPCRLRSALHPAQEKRAGRQSHHALAHCN